MSCHLVARSLPHRPRTRSATVGCCARSPAAPRSGGGCPHAAGGDERAQAVEPGCGRCPCVGHVGPSPMPGATSQGRRTGRCRFGAELCARRCRVVDCDLVVPGSAPDVAAGVDVDARGEAEAQVARPRQAYRAARAVRRCSGRCGRCRCRPRRPSRSRSRPRPRGRRAAPFTRRCCRRCRAGARRRRADDAVVGGVGLNVAGVLVTPLGFCGSRRRSPRCPRRPRTAAAAGPRRRFARSPPPAVGGDHRDRCRHHRCGDSSASTASARSVVGRPG